MYFPFFLLPTISMKVKQSTYCLKFVEMISFVSYTLRATITVTNPTASSGIPYKYYKLFKF